MKPALTLLFSAFFAAMSLCAQKIPVEGLADSPVRAIIYEDLQCSDCAASAPCWTRNCCRNTPAKSPSCIATSPWQNIPGPGGRPSQRASSPIANPNWAWNTGTTRWRVSAVTTDANFNMRLVDFAQAHGIAGEAAIAALANAHYAELVEQDYQDGVSRGVVHTPTVFVNGRPFIETFTFEEISKGIDQALAEALAQAH